MVITSVSGGRTSSYLALNYPSDKYIFSLVRIEDERCKPKDKGIIRYVEDKIGMEFIATAESDKTLYILRQLEQELGQEIIWVTGPTFEQVVKAKANYLPNRQTRFCTTEMKMTPIFWHCYLNYFKSEEDSITMQIGYRADEPKRTTDDTFKFIKSTNLYGQKQQNWETIEWRDSIAPLRKNGIVNFEVIKFFRDKPEYIFPKESNCAFCFNKTPQKLKDQFIEEPEKMRWASELEQKTGNTFYIGASLEQIRNLEFSGNLFEDNIVCNCHD